MFELVVVRFRLHFTTFAEDRLFHWCLSYVTALQTSCLFGPPQKYSLSWLSSKSTQHNDRFNRNDTVTCSGYLEKDKTLDCSQHSRVEDFMPSDIKEILVQSKSVIMFKVKKGREWLKTKFQRRVTSEQSPQRGIVIVCHYQCLFWSASRHKLTHTQGSPTDFRRAEMTLGTDCEGQPMLVEQAREDAQSSYHANRTGTWGKTIDLGGRREF